ncbi:class II glutamine amidotransferase [bacterium]|nr:class II glutamine amidotransferase [candidate division CSSED10-310 bacterium]
MKNKRSLIKIFCCFCAAISVTFLLIAVPYFLKWDTTYIPITGEGERNQRENCRLFAATVRPSESNVFIHEALNRFSYPTYQQRNGWSIAVYSEYYNNGMISTPHHPMIIRSEKNLTEDRYIYKAVTELVLRLKPQVVVAHQRNASSGCSQMANPHPFYQELNGKHYVFIHNGGVWGSDLDFLIRELIGNYGSPKSCPDDPIDSEYLFLYLLKIIDKNHETPLDASIIWGKTLLSHFTNQWNGLNFILSDGETVWTCRCSFNNNSFPLNYTTLGHSGGYAISTEPLDYNWTPMENFTVTEFKVGSYPQICKFWMPELQEDGF